MSIRSDIRQGLRQRFLSWKSGETLSQADLNRVAAKGPLAGQDLAMHGALQEALQRRSSSLGPGSLDEDSLLRRCQDNVDRLETPAELFHGGLPRGEKVRQGRDENCVLTSVAIGLAHHRPQVLQNILREDESGAIQLALPGQAPRYCDLPSEQDLLRHSCAYQSGLWMTVLSKELGTVGQLVPSQAIKLLTGSRSDEDIQQFTRASTTHRKLEESMNKGRVVLAGRGGWDREVSGLSKNHSYAVVGYDPERHQVQMQDPAGNEPLGPDGKARDGVLDGEFGVSLGEFRNWFSRVHYERPKEDSDGDQGSNKWGQKISQWLWGSNGVGNPVKG